MMRWGMAALALMSAAACAPQAPTYWELERMGSEYQRQGRSPIAAAATPEEATRRDSCAARAYREQIGTDASAQEWPAGARVIGPETAVTDDFRPSRLNIITDANGVITALECY
jgi:hypothetical protein